MCYFTEVLSLDVEVDETLYGLPVAVAGRVFNLSGRLVDSFDARIPDNLVTGAWVRKHVLPAIASMPVTHATHAELLDAFWFFWLSHKKTARVIAHCGAPVETNLFRMAVEADLERRQWNSFYPFYTEVGLLIELLGEDGTSVDNYIERHGLPKPVGVPHHPGYDAEATFTVYNHAMERITKALRKP